MNTTATPTAGRLADLDDPAVADALGRFAECFRPCFARADQFRRLEAYLRGLLGGAGRKSVLELARTAGGFEPGDTAQALHHFVGQSTWDENLLLARHRSRLRPGLPPGAFTASELAFPKRGSRSVGVQRQFGHSLGRKANCQIAVVVGHLSPAGWWPLAVRLYLPRDWSRDDARLTAAGVPPEARAPLSRPALALHLVESVRADAPAGSVLADAALAGSDEFRAGAEAAGLPAGPADPSSEAASGVGLLAGPLGLGHFEGRSWRGWHHHAALVILAYAFWRSLPTHS